MFETRDPSIPLSSRSLVMSEAGRGSESSDDEESEDDTLGTVPRCLHCVVLCTSILIANLCLLFLLSDLGPSVGVHWFAFVDQGHTDQLSLCMFGVACLAALFVYVLDWVNWGHFAKGLSGFIIASIFFVALCLHSEALPGAPVLLPMLVITVVILTYRRLLDAREVHRKEDVVWLYQIASCATFVCFGLLLLAYMYYPEEETIDEYDTVYPTVFNLRPLNRTSDCFLRNESMLQSKTTEDILDACAIASTYLYLVQMYPLVASAQNLTIAVIVFRTSNYIKSGKAKVGTIELALGCSFLAFSLTGMYAAASILAENVQLGNLLMFAFVAGTTIVVGWLYSVFDEGWEKDLWGLKETVNQTMNQQKIMEHLETFAQSDWVRAMFVGAFNVFIPFYLVLAWLRDKFRKTTFADKLMKDLGEWDWASILSKIFLLATVYFVLAVAFNKITYVFLSWLNDFLSQHLPFYGILVAAFLVAVLLFVLFPPLPGVAVYLFCGLLTLAQVNKSDSISFPVGCAIATVLALASKLAGSSCQFALGYFLGQNVTIQQQIGVDKVFIRAMEEILRRPGLNPGKVSILVGGPDWPTSVLCGVLRINLCQMLLGTAPILFVMFPTVMSGAYQTLVVPGDPSSGRYEHLASGCMILTACVQPFSTMLATQATFRVIAEKSDELAQPRKAHAEVEALSREQAKKDAVYKDVTKWTKLSCRLKFLIGAAALLAYLSNATFFFVGSKYCFRSFKVTNRISDLPEGNVFYIVRAPIGWLALGGYFMSALLYFAFRTLTKWKVENDEASSISDESDPEASE